VLLAESLSLFRDVGDERSAALAALYLGDALRDSDNLTQAAVRYRDALAEFATLDDRDQVAEGLLRLGRVLVREGEFENAARLIGAASAVAHDDEPGAGAGSPAITSLDNDLNAIRDILGEEAFTTAWDAGRALSLDAAVRVALLSATQ
jgi:tetratricopeptide (TPR) repeat protein